MVKMLKEEYDEKKKKNRGEKKTKKNNHIKIYWVPTT
jgi:hypothetical protein